MSKFIDRFFSLLARVPVFWVYVAILSFSVAIWSSIVWMLLHLP